MIVAIIPFQHDFDMDQIIKGICMVSIYLVQRTLFYMQGYFQTHSIQSWISWIWIMDMDIEGCAWHIECATTGRAMRKCCAEFYNTAMLLLLAGTVKAVKQGHHDRLSLTKKLFCKSLIFSTYLFSKWFLVSLESV